MEFDNTNRGVLFNNDRAESERHPQYKGSINIQGVDCWLSAWVKEGKNGKFFSLSVQPKDENYTPKPKVEYSDKPAPQIEDNGLPF